MDKRKKLEMIKASNPQVKLTLAKLVELLGPEREIFLETYIEFSNGESLLTCNITGQFKLAEIPRDPRVDTSNNFTAEDTGNV